MKTKLAIDDDLIRAAKELAQRQGVSAGKIVSRLMRSALLAPNDIVDAGRASRFEWLEFSKQMSL